MIWSSSPRTWNTLNARHLWGTGLKMDNIRCFGQEETESSFPLHLHLRSVPHLASSQKTMGQEVPDSCMTRAFPGTPDRRKPKNGRHSTLPQDIPLPTESMSCRLNPLRSIPSQDSEAGQCRWQHLPPRKSCHSRTCAASAGSG